MPVSFSNILDLLKSPLGVSAITPSIYIIQAYGNLSDCTGHVGGLDFQELMLIIRCGDTTYVVFCYGTLRSTLGLVDANVN